MGVELFPRVIEEQVNFYFFSVFFVKRRSIIPSLHRWQLLWAQLLPSQSFCSLGFLSALIPSQHTSSGCPTFPMSGTAGEAFPLSSGNAVCLPLPAQLLGYFGCQRGCSQHVLLEYKHTHTCDVNHIISLHFKLWCCEINRNRLLAPNLCQSL